MNREAPGTRLVRLVSRKGHSLFTARAFRSFLVLWARLWLLCYGDGVRWLRKWGPLCVGPVALVIIVFLVDPATLASAFAQADLGLFGVAVAIAVCSVPLRALRWRLIVGPGKSSYWDFVATYAYAIFVGMATPGRVGEFVKTFHLTRNGMSVTAAVTTVLLDRLFDVAVLFVVAFVAVLTLAVPEVDAALPFLGVLVGLAVACYLGWKAFASAWFDGKLQAHVLAKQGKTGALLKKIANIRSDALTALKPLSTAMAAFCLLLTVVSWAVTYGANFCLSLSLDLPLTYLQVAGISAVASLVAQLPISVLGAGTRDAALIVVLGTYGISTVQAVALSTFFLAVVVGASLVCSLSLLNPAVRVQLRQKEEQ